MARPGSSEARTERLIGRLADRRRRRHPRRRRARSRRELGRRPRDARPDGALDLVGSELLVLLGLGLSVLTWRRSLGEVGSALGVPTASRVYLLGQLGKYLPGSVWALVAQAELGRSVGVPRTRGLAASLIAVAVNACTGLAMGVVLFPRVSDRPWAIGVGRRSRDAVRGRARAADPHAARRPGPPRREAPGARASCDVARNRGSGRLVRRQLGELRRRRMDPRGGGRSAGRARPCVLCVAGVPLAMNVGLFVFVPRPASAFARQ